MDKGRPFRVSQSTDRRALNRPEPAYRPAEEARPVAEPAQSVAPVSVRTAHAAPAKEEKPSKRFKWPVIVGIVVLLGVAGMFAWSKLQGGAAMAIDGNKYQVVAFANGQMYFGKLHAFNGEYMKLTDIYYLQTQDGKNGSSENPQQTAANQNDIQLIKLGDEIHGPEDEMMISKDQVLYYENLKDDGKVAQAIAKFKGAN